MKIKREVSLDIRKQGAMKGSKSCIYFEVYRGAKSWCAMKMKRAVSKFHLHEFDTVL